MEYYSYQSELENVRRKLAKLEQENKNLRFELYQLTDSYKEAINKIPLPIVLINKSGNVYFHNDHFVSLLDFRGREIMSRNIEINGIHISEITDSELYSHIEPFIARGASFSDKYINIKDRFYSLSVNSIRKGEFCIAVFRMISTSDEKREEMMHRIDEVIESNLEMVQKIGSLMGEEVSKTNEILGTIIKMVK